MAGNVAFFSAKTVSMSKTGGRKPCDLLKAARHNLREIQAELGSVGRIDPRRTKANVLLFGPDTAQGVQKAADALLAGVDTSRLRRDSVQAVETVFSVPADYADPVTYFRRCLEWLAEALPLPLLSAVVHLDEDCPHAHVLMLPVRDGRHVGGSPVVRPELKRLREAYFAKVAAPAGFQRGEARLYGEAKHTAVEAVKAECEARRLPELNGPVWSVMCDCIHANPLPWVKALGIDLTEAGRARRSATSIGLVKMTSIIPPPIGLDADREEEPTPILCRASRHSVAQQAIARAIARSWRPTPMLVQDDGVILRERDEHSHGTDHWD